MENGRYKVLVQTDDAGRVTAINSDAFISSDDWTAVDEGEGNRYLHAQNNYLIQPLTDENGILRYKLINGVVVQRTSAEMKADYESMPKPPPTIEERVKTLEAANDDVILMLADLIGG